MVEGVGELRNKMGDAHGKSTNSPGALSHYAEFAVNLSGAASLFLVASWEATKSSEVR